MGLAIALVIHSVDPSLSSQLRDLLWGSSESPSLSVQLIYSLA